MLCLRTGATEGSFSQITGENMVNTDNRFFAFLMNMWEGLIRIARPTGGAFLPLISSLHALLISVNIIIPAFLAIIISLAAVYLCADLRKGRRLFGTFFSVVCWALRLAANLCLITAVFSMYGEKGMIPVLIGQFSVLQDPAVILGIGLLFAAFEMLLALCSRVFLRLPGTVCGLLACLALSGMMTQVSHGFLISAGLVLVVMLIISLPVTFLVNTGFEAEKPSERRKGGRDVPLKFRPSERGRKNVVWIHDGRTEITLEEYYYDRLQELFSSFIRKDTYFLNTRELTDRYTGIYGDDLWPVLRDDPDKLNQLRVLMDLDLETMLDDLKAYVCEIMCEDKADDRIRRIFRDPSEYGLPYRDGDALSLGEIYDTVLYVSAGHRASDRLMEELECYADIYSWEIFVEGNVPVDYRTISNAAEERVRKRHAGSQTPM